MQWDTFCFCSPTIHDLCKLKKIANLSDLFFSAFITIRNM